MFVSAVFSCAVPRRFVLPQPRLRAELDLFVLFVFLFYVTFVSSVCLLLCISLRGPSTFRAPTVSAPRGQIHRERRFHALPVRGVSRRRAFPNAQVSPNALGFPFPLPVYRSKIKQGGREENPAGRGGRVASWPRGKSSRDGCQGRSREQKRERSRPWGCLAVSQKNHAESSFVRGRATRSTDLVGARKKQPSWGYIFI